MTPSFFLFLVTVIVLFILLWLLQIKKQHESFVDSLPTSTCSATSPCFVAADDLATKKTKLPYSYNVINFGNGKRITKVDDLVCRNLANTMTLYKTDCKQFYMKQVCPTVTVTNLSNNNVSTILSINGLELGYCPTNNCYQFQAIGDETPITHVTVTLTKPGALVTIMIALVGKPIASTLFTLPRDPNTSMLSFRGSISPQITSTGITFEKSVFYDYKSLFQALSDYQYKALQGKVIPYEIRVTFTNEDASTLHM